MKSIALFFETTLGKRVKNFIIGAGASVVLIGALAKIEHWPIASLMLQIGMFTEAFIFLLLGILPPHKDYYWERFYPNIDENPHVEAYQKGIKFAKPEGFALGGGSGSGASATASLDKMLAEANINPANLSRLNDNFQKFGQTVDQVKDVSNVMAATNEFTQKTKEAGGALEQMKSTFVNATSAMDSFNNASEDTAKFHGQVQVLTKNLSSLNNIYELELNEANNHLKNMNKFYGSLVSATESMASSADDANRAKDQIALLAKNLGSLNNVYGNMLSAMQGR
jgi:gliding motility-associated protein GldL